MIEKAKRFCIAAVSAVAMAAPPALAQQYSSTGCFLSSLGVNIHADYAGTPYQNDSGWMPLLLGAGFFHVRDNWWINDAGNDSLIEQLAANGVKVAITSDWMIYYNVDPQTVVNYLVANPALNAAIFEILGPNEINSTVANYPIVVPGFMRALYAAIKGNPATSHIKISGPGFSAPDNVALFQALGDVSTYIDYGDMHNTPNGNQGPHIDTDAWLNTMYNNEAINAGTKFPYLNSEFGYSTGTDQYHIIGIPANTVATMYLHNWLEDFRRGVQSSDAYELLDEGNDGSYYNSQGLLTGNLSPKPVYNAIKAVTTLIADRPQYNAFGLPSSYYPVLVLDYNITGGDANMRELVLQKQDGTYWLMVWEQEEVWDPTTYQVLSAASFPVTLNMSKAATGAVYVPETNGTTAVATFSGANSISFTASEKVTMIHLNIGNTGLSTFRNVPRPLTCASLTPPTPTQD